MDKLTKRCLEEGIHTLGSLLDAKRQNLTLDDIKGWSEHYFIPLAKRCLENNTNK